MKESGFGSENAFQPEESISDPASVIGNIAWERDKVDASLGVDFVDFLDDVAEIESVLFPGAGDVRVADMNPVNRTGRVRG